MSTTHGGNGEERRCSGRGPGDPGERPAHGDGSRGPLAGEAVPGDGTNVDLDALSRELASPLPAHVVPTAIVGLSVTANGKLDPDALQQPRDAAPAALRSPIERELAAIWQELLELPAPPRPADDFFALGGDSLAALALLAAIEERFGRWLGAASILRSATLSGMAAELVAPPQGSSPIIPLRPAGTRPPWFFVVADHRAVVGMRNVLPALLHDQPAYAVQAVDPANPSWRRSTVAGIAESCTRAVRNRQPHGPYRLGGYSLGGYVAWELACQLERLGETVELLALLDTPSPDAFTWSGRFATRRRQLRGARPLRRARGYAGLLRESAEHTVHLALGRLSAPLSEPREREDPWDQSGAWRLVRRYRAGRFGGSPVVFHTDPTTAEIGRATLGWELHARGPVQAEPIPGDHHSALAAAHVERFAELVAQRLERLDRTRTPS